MSFKLLRIMSLLECFCDDCQFGLKRTSPILLPNTEEGKGRYSYSFQVEKMEVMEHNIQAVYYYQISILPPYNHSQLPN